MTNAPVVVDYPLSNIRGELENMRRWAAAIRDWTVHMRAAGRREQTIDLRRYQIGRLAEDRLRRSPWKVTADELKTWLVSHDWSPATLHSYASAIRAFYRWAHETGRTKHNPAKRLTGEPPRGVPHPTPRHVSDQALAEGTNRDRLAILLALDAGLRRAEIATLRWSDISDGQIRVQGKGGDERVVPTSERLDRELDAERTRREAGYAGSGYRHADPGSAYVMPGKTGGPMDGKSISRAVRRLLGGEWTLHSLRHAYATDMLEAGVDLATVQELLGHVSPATTRIYTLVSMRTRRAAIDAVQRYRNREE